MPEVQVKKQKCYLQYKFKLVGSEVIFIFFTIYLFISMFHREVKLTALYA